MPCLMPNFNLKLISITIILCWGNIKAFRPDRMRLVDIYHKNGNTNFLFRSGSPLTNNFDSFNWTGIYDQMLRLSIDNEDKITFPKKIMFVDYSLLNYEPQDDKECLKVERKFFEKNIKYYPQLSASSHVVNWPIHGDKHSPYSIHNITQRNLKSKNFDIWSSDGLPILVDMLHTNIHERYPISIVFFVHCMEGVDRTGEIIGAYQMKYQNKSLEDIIYEDTLINNGKAAPKLFNLNSLLWYELYLKN